MNFQKPRFKVPCVDLMRDLRWKREHAVTIVQAKQTSPKALRIRQLKDLVYQTFVGDLVPAGQRKRFDIYAQAKPVIRDLGAKGGDEYYNALTRVKYTWSGVAQYEKDQAYRDAVAILLPRK